MVADERGAFRMDAVNPGHYTVSVLAGGFEMANTRDLYVAPSIVTTFDPVLTVGEVSQAVNVEANTNNINTEKRPAIEYGRHDRACEDPRLHFESH